VYEVLQNYSKMNKFCSWNHAVVKAKMLAFVLPTEKRLVLTVSFWTFFQYLGNQSELEKTLVNRNLVLKHHFRGRVKLNLPFLLR